MALLFLDSFDHYLESDDKYVQGGASITTGRHGQGADGNFYVAFPQIASATSIIGSAARIWFFGGSGIFNLGDVHGFFFGLSVLSAGQLVTNIGNRSTPADTVRKDQWHYIEMQTTVHVVPGGASPYDTIAIDRCHVWVDGLLVLDETDLGESVALINGTTPNGWNMAGCGTVGGGVTFDDLYICDGSGPAPWNAPLGDVQIDVIRPNGVGAVSQWSPVGAPAGWSATNDMTPDDDATKVVAATAGLSDLYALEDINTSNGIIGAQLLINARRTEEGFATLAPLLHHAGVTTQLPTRSLSPSYFYRNRDVFVTMPNGDPLTDANVNALQAGFKRLS